MVRALHAAGIEVILDTVCYHTAQAGPCGPILCFRGAGPGCLRLQPAAAIMMATRRYSPAIPHGNTHAPS